MKICAAPRRPMMTAKNPENHHLIVFRPRCRSWQCPACAEINVRLYAGRAHHGAQALSLAGHDVAFLTLTSHEKVRDDVLARRIWRDAWPRLRKRAAREAGSLDYQCVPERHDDGAWHWHLVTMPLLGERWWKDNARECGLGYMVDESIIQSPIGVSWYIAKYLTKTLGSKQEWPRDWRRLRTSRTWPRQDMGRPEGWEFGMLPPTTELANYVNVARSEGWRVHLADHQAAWAWIETIDALEP